MYCIKYSTHPKTTHITHNLLTSKKKDICIHTIQIQMMMIFVRFYEKKEIKARRISKGLLYLLMSFSSHFGNLVFGHSWRQSYKNTKLLCNLCLHFARQDEKDGKNPGKEIMLQKWPKYQKQKDKNMGLTKH